MNWPLVIGVPCATYAASQAYLYYSKRGDLKDNYRNSSEYLKIIGEEELEYSFFIDKMLDKMFGWGRNLAIKKFKAGKFD